MEPRSFTKTNKHVCICKMKVSVKCMYCVRGEVTFKGIDWPSKSAWRHICEWPHKRVSGRVFVMRKWFSSVVVFVSRGSHGSWCGSVWGAERRHRAGKLVNRGGWSALAAVHPYYDRPPCRAPACLPASSDSSVGGSSAASTARPPRLESGLLLIRGFKPRRLKQCGRRDKMQVRGWWWGFWGVTGSWG